MCIVSSSSRSILVRHLYVHVISRCFCIITITATVFQFMFHQSFFIPSYYLPHSFCLIFQKAYSGFVSPLFGDKSSFIQDVVRQYKELCDAAAPTWETNSSLMVSVMRNSLFISFLRLAHHSQSLVLISLSFSRVVQLFVIRFYSHS